MASVSTTSSTTGSETEQRYETLLQNRLPLIKKNGGHAIKTKQPDKKIKKMEKRKIG